MNQQRARWRADLFNADQPQWKGPGPDARITSARFIVTSYGELLDPSQPFAGSKKGAWQRVYASFKAAKGAYERRIVRECTQECSIELRLKFGTGLFSIGEIPFNETYICLVRWRSDGAFLESYHVNEAKFAERDHGRRTDELVRIRGVPGRRSAYIKWQEERAKKSRNNTGPSPSISKSEADLKVTE